MTEVQTRVWVDVPLLDQVKKEYPETEGMTYAGTNEWALRKLVTLKKEGAQNC